MRALGLNAQDWDTGELGSGAPVDGGQCRPPGHSAQGEGILREGCRFGRGRGRIGTRSAGSATMTMPRASSIVSSPKNENERACRIHRAKGETLPSLGGDRIRGRLSPRSLCYAPAGDRRKRNELTIPDLEETLCGLFKQPPWWVRKLQVC